RRQPAAALSLLSGGGAVGSVELPESSRSRHLWPIVVRIDTGVIGGAVDANPIRSIDASRLLDRRARRESARRLDPSILKDRDLFHILDGFGEILILAEDQRDIVIAIERKTYDIQGDTNVDTLFLANQRHSESAVGQGYCLITVTQDTGECMNSARSHHRHFSRPELVPKW